jgi:hypothetical protein
MSRARRRVGTTISSSPEMTARASERVALENALRQALEARGSTSLQADLGGLHTHRCRGPAALAPPRARVRVAHRDHADRRRVRLIVTPGDWVLCTASAQHRAWLDCGLPPLRVSTCAIFPAIGTMPPSSRPSWRLAGSSGSVWSPRAWTARPRLEFLKTHGCDEIQGYCFGRPCRRAGAGAAAPRSRLIWPRADAVLPSRYSFGSPGRNGLQWGMACNGAR